MVNADGVIREGGSLTRKVSRKLSKRPKKLELATPFENTLTTPSEENSLSASTSVLMGSSATPGGVVSGNQRSAVVEERGRGHHHHSEEGPAAGKAAPPEARLAYRRSSVEDVDDGILVGEGSAQVWVFGGAAAVKAARMVCVFD